MVTVPSWPNPETNEIVAGGYGFDVNPSARSEVSFPRKLPKQKLHLTKKEKTPSRSLGETLLSQGSINIALYLQFLILAAALYYTASSGSLRTPRMGVRIDKLPVDQELIAKTLWEGK